MKISDKV